MRMNDHKDDGVMIDALLSDVRSVQVTPDDSLMARVMADAHRVDHSEPAAQPAASWWAALHDLLGGWPTVGGMALAGVAGLWVGIAPPAPVENLAAGVFGTTDTVSLLDFDLALEGLADG